MIDSNDVKEAVFNELSSLFNGSTIYKEEISSPAFPHFYIYVIEVSDTEGRKNYHQLNYSMEVRYRQASDTSTVLDIQNELDKVGFQLLNGFNHIHYENETLRCENKSVEKVDKVLHFFFNCKMNVKYVNENEVKPLRMNLLKTNIGVRK